MRSHRSRRSRGRGTETAAGPETVPVSVTVSGSPGLLIQLTARQELLHCRGLGQHVGLFSLTIHAGAARRNVQPSWIMPGKHLFPDHLPQRRVAFPTVGMQVEVFECPP